MGGRDVCAMLKIFVGASRELVFKEVGACLDTSANSPRCIGPSQHQPDQLLSAQRAQFGKWHCSLLSLVTERHPPLAVCQQSRWSWAARTCMCHVSLLLDRLSPGAAVSCQAREVV